MQKLYTTTKHMYEHRDFQLLEMQMKYPQETYVRWRKNDLQVYPFEVTTGKYVFSNSKCIIPFNLVQTGVNKLASQKF